MVPLPVPDAALAALGAGALVAIPVAAAAAAMMRIAGMRNGRVMVVMHEGYRVPGYIRAQCFDVTPGGPVACG